MNPRSCPTRLRAAPTFPLPKTVVYESSTCSCLCDVVDKLATRDTEIPTLKRFAEKNSCPSVMEITS